MLLLATVVRKYKKKMMHRLTKEFGGLKLGRKPALKRVVYLLNGRENIHFLKHVVF
jgi:hypothetical protein